MSLSYFKFHIGGTLDDVYSIFSLLNELHREKTNVLVSDLVRHKPGCAATEDG